METKTKTKHPEIAVELIGQDGNAFFIISKVREALNKAGFGEEVKQFTNEAMASGYDDLLCVVMNWVTIF